MEDTMKQCMQSCTECSATCVKTIEYCLEKGGSHADPAHINLMQDCEDICMLATSFMERGSEHTTRLCELSAEICESCAESCEAFTDDEDMKKCAEACRQCAKDCREMAGV